MPAGRPTDFRPEYVEQARKLANLGATDIEIADFFEIDVRTLYRWRNTHEEFCQALKAGKDQLDARIETSLFHRATGYERDSIKIFCNKDGEVTKVPFREYVPPDTTACIFWLKNRKSAEWRDRQEHTGANGEPLQFVVTRARSGKPTGE